MAMLNRRLCVLLMVVWGALATGASAADRAIDPGRALSFGIRNLRMDGVALEEALSFVRDLTGVNIHVDWPALRQAGVDRLSPVTVRAARISVSKAMELILNSAGGGEALGFYVDGNVLHVTTAAAADQVLVTRVYFVRDLVMLIPDFEGPEVEVSSIGNTGGSPFTEAESPENEREAEQERIDQLIEMITSTVRPDVWRQNGGIATIRYFNGHLVVRAPQSVHEALGIGQPLDR